MKFEELSQGEQQRWGDVEIFLNKIKLMNDSLSGKCPYCSKKMELFKSGLPDRVSEWSPTMVKNAMTLDGTTLAHISQTHGYQPEDMRLFLAQAIERSCECVRRKGDGLPTCDAGDPD